MWFLGLCFKEPSKTGEGLYIQTVPVVVEEEVESSREKSKSKERFRERKVRLSFFFVSLKSCLVVSSSTGRVLFAFAVRIE